MVAGNNPFTVNNLVDVLYVQDTDVFDSRNRSLHTGVVGTPTVDGNVNYSLVVDGKGVSAVKITL